MAKKELEVVASTGWGLSNLDGQCQHQLLSINVLLFLLVLK